MDNNETFRERLRKVKRYKGYIIVSIPHGHAEEVVEPDADRKKKTKKNR